MAASDGVKWQFSVLQVAGCYFIVDVSYLHIFASEISEYWEIINN